MRNGAAACALAFISASVAIGSSAFAAAAAGTLTTPTCTPASGPVVWYVQATKTYYLTGSPRYAIGNGKFVCRATAVAMKGHVAMSTAPTRKRGSTTTPMTMPMPMGSAMPMPMPMPSPSASLRS